MDDKGIGIQVEQAPIKIQLPLVDDIEQTRSMCREMAAVGDGLTVARRAHVLCTMQMREAVVMKHGEG